MVSENPTRNHFYLLRWLYLPYLYQQNILETQINCIPVKEMTLPTKIKGQYGIQRPKPKTTTGLGGVSAAIFTPEAARKVVDQAVLMLKNPPDTDHEMNMWQMENLPQELDKSEHQIKDKYGEETILPEWAFWITARTAQKWPHEKKLEALKKILQMKLTVILPSAGKGTRLNLPYPKEILRLDNDNALIDNCFNFFKDYGRNQVEFIVVINEDKTDLIKYLAKYKDRYNISFVFQNPSEKEYTGAIKSAYHLFGEHNIVLLPDTLMKLQPGKDLYTLTTEALEETNGFSFLIKKEENREVLKTKGAIYVNKEGNVVEYEDKPTDRVEYYNAFWCAFAFRRRNFYECINFMEKSTLKQKHSQNEITQTPIFGSKVIEVENYIDLGTWPEIRRLLIDYEKDNN